MNHFTKVLSLLAFAILIPSSAFAQVAVPKATCRLMWAPAPQANSNNEPTVLLAKTFELMLTSPADGTAEFAGQTYLRIPNGVFLRAMIFGEHGSRNASNAFVEIGSGAATLNATGYFRSDRSILAETSSVGAIYITPQGPRYFAECTLGK